MWCDTEIVEGKAAEMGGAGAAAAGGARRKVNTRGRVQLEGVQDFDPNANVKLDGRPSERGARKSEKGGKKEKKDKCC